VWWPDRRNPILIDGRNRLDALALAGLLFETEDHHLGLRRWDGKKWSEKTGDRMGAENVHGGNPYAHVLSFNAHRRHLISKRDQVAIVLAAQPEKSDRAIATEVGVSPTTVGKVRQLSTNGQLKKKRVGKDGKKRKLPTKRGPAAKRRAPPIVAAAAGIVELNEELEEAQTGDERLIAANSEIEELKELLAARDARETAGAPKALTTEAIVDWLRIYVSVGTLKEVTGELLIRSKKSSPAFMGELIRRSKMSSPAIITESPSPAIITESGAPAPVEPEPTPPPIQSESDPNKDVVLEEFDGHVGALARLIGDAEPVRFAKTTIATLVLGKVGRTLTKIVRTPDDLTIPACLRREPAS
jgi:hypothetical protein